MPYIGRVGNDYTPAKPKERGHDIGDLLSQGSNFAVKQMHTNHRDRALRAQGVHSDAVSIWDQLDPKNQQEAYDTRNWTNQSQGNRGDLFNDFSQGDQDQGQTEGQYKHPSRFNTGTMAGDITAHNEELKYERDRAYKIQDEQLQYERNLVRKERDEVVKNFKNTLAEGRKNKEIQSLLCEMKTLFHKAHPETWFRDGGSTQVGWLDPLQLKSWRNKNVIHWEYLYTKLIAVVLGDHPTETQLKIFEYKFPSIYDNAAVQFDKIQLIEKEIIFHEQIEQVMRYIVRTNNGIVPIDIENRCQRSLENQKMIINVNTDPYQYHEYLYVSTNMFYRVGFGVLLVWFYMISKKYYNKMK